MNYKTAQNIIKANKRKYESWHLEKFENRPHYRVYRVTPITSFMHKLPYTDIYTTAILSYLTAYCNCSVNEAMKAIYSIGSGKIGVCVKSWFTTYLVERFS